jgi:hypothetical protein
MNKQLIDFHSTEIQKERTKNQIETKTEWNLKTENQKHQNALAYAERGW